MPSADSRASGSGRHSILWLIAPMVALSAASIDIYLPSLPGIAAHFRAGPDQVQLTLSAFLYGYGFTQLLCGPMSDRFGRRPVLLGGLILYVAATIGCLFAPSIEALIVLRFIQAVGACVGPVLGRAIARDVYPVEQMARVFAYLAMVFTVAPIVGPMLGGYLETAFGWRANFILLVVIGAALLVAAFALLGETNRHLNPLALRPGRLLGNYAALLANRRFLGYALAAGIGFSGVFAFISESPFLLIELLGLSPQWYGAVFGLSAIGFGIGSFASSRLAPRHGIEATIAVGIGCYLAAALVMNGLAFAGILNVFSIVLPMTGIGIAIGLIIPNCQAGAVGPYPAMAGAASALVGFAQTAISSSAGIAVGQLHDGTQFPLTLATLVCAALLVVLFYGLIRRGAGPQC